ncbi:hypothetical protein B9L19_15285 [Geobacillus thermocatenulatus]|uniref:Uncharacterized protein n=2 Tax=Anoxybacillaceae TaxID=3120669 RepID=A0A226Q558_9BACL|nr:hypothetical protein GT3921_16370 [Geobacillus thermocatenulatus]KLR75384.1 hypothetical protein ABH20_00455 [Geobacillus sp. T6]OXB86840.1 hypothetical protein B9L19_15285 [Geobacillus thermocatenulatus]RAN30186.1 hypothetical protein VC88_03555 [Geobacillus sp. A8]
MDPKKSYLILALTMLSVLLFSGCNHFLKKENRQPLHTSDTISFHENEHFIIPNNAQEQLGFIPDTATSFAVDSKLKKKWMIDNESVDIVSLKPGMKQFTFNFIIDSLKDRDRHFRLFIFHNQKFVKFSINNKKYTYYDIRMKGNGSLKIPIRVQIANNDDFSEYLPILIDKDQKHFFTENIPVTKILVSKKNKNDFSEIPSHIKLDNVQKIFKKEKSKSNEFGLPSVVLLNDRFTPLKVEEVHKARYVRIDQSPHKMVEEIMFFDMEGNIYGLKGKQPRSYTLEQPKDQDFIIPIPKEITLSSKKRFFLLINNNPREESFIHLDDIQKGKSRVFLNFANLYEIR